jgi:hypothetical protein
MQENPISGLLDIIIFWEVTDVCWAHETVNGCSLMAACHVTMSHKNKHNKKGLFLGF